MDAPFVGVTAIASKEPHVQLTRIDFGVDGRVMSDVDFREPFHVVAEQLRRAAEYVESAGADGMWIEVTVW